MAEKKKEVKETAEVKKQNQNKEVKEMTKKEKKTEKKIVEVKDLEAEFGIRAKVIRRHLRQHGRIHQASQLRKIPMVGRFRRISNNQKEPGSSSSQKTTTLNR